MLLKHMGHQEKTDAFDFECLMVMGLLHCVDRSRPVGKAKAFYGIMQDGGSEKHRMINARDKDWIPIANKVFRLACFVSAELSAESGRYSTSELG